MSEGKLDFSELLKTPILKEYKDGVWAPMDEDDRILIDDIDDDRCEDPNCTFCNPFQAKMEEEQKYDKTLIIIKPDAVRRRIVSKVFKRLEATELTLKFMELRTLTLAEAESLYNEHSWEDFYDDLISFITSGPCIVMVWEGDKAAAKMRNIIGNKHPSDSPSGTIRGDCGGKYPETVVHGSDPWSAKREVGIFYDI